MDEPAALTGFQAWKVIHFTPAERGDPAISGPDANPDGDRWSNFTEYAFVTDPRTSGGELLPTARVEGGLLKVVFRRLKSPSDVAYRLDIATERTGSGVRPGMKPCSKWSVLMKPVKPWRLFFRRVFRQTTSFTCVS